MRKQIDGLAVLPADVLAADSLSSHLFTSCNRARDKTKILFWCNNAFWLWRRRVEQRRFWWPKGAQEELLALSMREWASCSRGLVRAEAHKWADFGQL
jgi:hypothetical protein